MAHSGRSKHGPPTILLLTIGVPAMLIFLSIEKIVVVGSTVFKKFKRMCVNREYHMLNLNKY